jgi:signal peptidase I
MMTALLAGAGLIALVIALRGWLARRWIVVTVEGHSMSPTLRHGQRVFARRRSPLDACAHGDIVVFEVPGARVRAASGGPRHRVKRIAAIAGDPVPSWAHPALGTGPVPPGHVVVSGDNARSQDSRQLGFIDQAAIVAVLPARGQR